MYNYPLMKRKRVGGFAYPYSIDYAAKLDGSANLSSVYSAAAGWTFSALIKRSSFGAVNKVLNTDIQFNSNDTLTAEGLTTTAVYRDPSHWLHLYASDNGLYINGVKMGDVSTGTLSNITVFDGFDGYAANIILIDGITVPVTAFGEFVYNTWVPKRYTGSYGTNGFHLNFANSTYMGIDVSGNANHFGNNGAVQTTDTPTNNYPTLDGTTEILGGTSLAGLRWTGSGAGTINNGGIQKPTIPIPSTGTWQWELTTVSNAVYTVMGVSTINNDYWMWGGGSGYWYYEGTYEASGLGVPGVGTYSMTYDADTTVLTFYQDGSLLGSFTLSDYGYDGEELFFVGGDAKDTATVVYDCNFGAEGFEYPIEGVNAICTANLPTPTILNPELGMWMPTWTGDGTNKDIVGSSFDLRTKSLIWIKCSSNTIDHNLYDTERGVNIKLESNTSSAETDSPLYGYVSAFLENGFSVYSTSTRQNVNSDGYGYIAWILNMLPQYGMDIVAYTGDGVAGRTVAHNLGFAPEMIIIKQRDGTGYWIVGHKDMDVTAPWDYGLWLQSTGDRVNATYFNDTAPGASVFTLGDTAFTNADGKEFIAYLFRSIPGFMKVGSYAGNANADGPRVYTGFRPKYLLVRHTADNYNWNIMWNKMGYNVEGTRLFANTNSTEDTSSNFYHDILSNGFKIRSSYTGINKNNSTHLYLAFADMPFPYCNAY